MRFDDISFVFLNRDNLFGILTKVFLFVDYRRMISLDIRKIYHIFVLWILWINWITLHKNRK